MFGASLAAANGNVNAWRPAPAWRTTYGVGGGVVTGTSGATGGIHVGREGAMERKGNDWEEVVRRKRRPPRGGDGSVDVATNAWKVSLMDTVSFYFSDFPETHGAREMLKAFKFYGDAMEVVIPSKRDRWGKRFGFVRFSNVEDPRIFAIKLDNIIFGAKKIHVNIPRFQRERFGVTNQRQLRSSETRKVGDLARKYPLPNQNGDGALSRKRSDLGVRNLTFQHLRQDPPHHVQERRVNQVWVKKVGGNDGGKKTETRSFHNKQTQVHYRKNNNVELCYNVSEAELGKFKKMYVGTVRTPGSTYAVQEWFNMQGFFSIKITPLGANKVLMEEMEEGVFEILINEYKDWLHEKFDDVRAWDPDVVDNERVVWVRCHGVPIHAWNEEFFASLARKFGEYLGVDEATRVKSSMDVARIRLRTNAYDVFNAVVTANINESFFHIKMVEEWCGPLHWLENRCCKRISDPGSGSDEDDGNGNIGSPPLFTAVEDWCSNFDEEGEDVVGGSDEEEGTSLGSDEESFVQETIGNFEETWRFDPTIRVELSASGNGGKGNGKEVGEVSLKLGDENRSLSEGGNRDLVRVTSGVQNDNVLEVASSHDGIIHGEGCVKNMNGETILEEALGTQIVLSGKEGGGRSGLAAMPSKSKKKLGVGPLKRKSKVKSMKKRKVKRHEGAPHLEIPITNAAAENQPTPATLSLQSQGGVVRNPIGVFQPAGSGSVSSTAAASHVESIGDSGILMGNSRFDAELEKAKASKLWHLATDKLGVSVDEGEEEMFIERLRALEEKANMVKSKKGNKAGTK